MLWSMEETFMINRERNVITSDNTQNIATGQGDDYTTSCLLGYPYLNNYFKMIAMDLRK